MNKLNIIGLTATVLGVGLSLLTDWVEDKKIEKEIGEKVAKAVEKELKELI